MKPASLAAWNKRSTLWLSLASGNLVSSKAIQCEQGAGWIDNHIMTLRQKLEGETSQGSSKKIKSRKETDK
jgi:hypothetical protein